MVALIGVILIMFGGMSSGSYYLPLKYVKSWSWESGWIIQGLFAWIIGPWIIAMITIPDLFRIIGETPTNSIVIPIIFGLGWGIGGLTWGLCIRYLGIGLGNALPLGLTSALSTIISPLVPILVGQTKTPEGMCAALNNQLGKMFSGTQGSFMISSILLSLAGIAVCGWAASMKSKEINKDATGQEFNLKKGLLVALIAGVMSACFAFGEASGKGMAAITETYNPGSIWKYNGVYAIILIGGFMFNFIYCFILSFKNKSFGDYRKQSAPLAKNYIFASMAGLIWFSQFVFKGMGTTLIPSELSFITWTILFSCTIVFSNIIGLITKEWKGVSRKTIIILTSGLLLLILSVTMVGLASKL
jgi:L-rhamnose-H+ transport protein